MLQMQSIHQLNVLGNWVYYVHVQYVCVCVGEWESGWVLNTQCCKALRDRWLLSLIVSWSTSLSSLALVPHPVLAVASQHHSPTHATSTRVAHTHTHTLGSIWVPPTLQGSQAAYSATTANPAAASDLTHAGIQTNTLIAATGYWLSRFSLNLMAPHHFTTSRGKLMECSSYLKFTMG